jgi:hypothetical protein
MKLPANGHGRENLHSGRIMCEETDLEDVPEHVPEAVASRQGEGGKAVIVHDILPLRVRCSQTRAGLAAGILYREIFHR